MNSDPVKEVLSELFSHLERLETQSTAVLLFLKEKKRVTDKQLAPYLERAGNASNVRWRAERVRMEYLLTQTDVKAEEEGEGEKAAPPGAEHAASSPEEQAAPGSSGQDDSANGEKVRPEDESHEVAHGEQEAAEAMREQQPEHDSGHRAEVQTESADESRDDKEEGGQKVA